MEALFPGLNAGVSGAPPLDDRPGEGETQHRRPGRRGTRPQLVDDAQRGTIEAIADLRVLAPASTRRCWTTASPTRWPRSARSALHVELVIDIPERPSAAIEAIAYFSAAELLTNAARHSGARHVTLEAVHVSGLLRIRVSDDGNGGARLVPGGCAGWPTASAPSTAAWTSAARPATPRSSPPNCHPMPDNRHPASMRIVIAEDAAVIRRAWPRSGGRLRA